MPQQGAYLFIKLVDSLLSLLQSNTRRELAWTRVQQGGQNGHG